LDRSLTYRRHLESLPKILTSRVAHLWRVLASRWCAGATTLRIATLALVHSTAEYCVPIWCRSAHTRLIADNLQNPRRHPPAELRRNGATLSLARRATESGDLLHSALTRPSIANAAPQIETPICTRRTQPHQFF